ncbi:transcriptional regulator FtrA [Halomonas sp. GFAJ-1]|uniref:transcriptional regulator FtrA n=1 Tax=Halomonas sp. GFAJ-1 TaxID=1118153 RepID=UPI00023A5968|nr:transcriptional regulator FtrA [Halomonas sp. GFAJ-1]EHK61955.1 transcriptional activator FtrA [Halomonas sp. GFAJ-1]
MAVLPCMLKIMPKSDHARKLANPLVVAIAYDGLCTFELGVAVEVFGLPRPEMGENWYQFKIAGIDPGEMRAIGGMRVVVDAGIEIIDQAGTIIIPGWRGATEPVPATLIKTICKAHANGARVLSICSGVFVLAEAGLLKGRRGTTHWRYTDTLSQRYPEIAVEPDVLYIDEGDVMTSAGSAAGIDLCLHLVRRDHGMQAANMVARRLVVPPHRDGGQAQFIERAVPSLYESSRIGPLLDHIREEIDGNYTVASMASIVGMSSRTFLRRFEAATGTTPAKWLLIERLEKARCFLESSTMTIEQIATASGFGSTANLRHHFRQQLLTTPTAYREMFQRALDQ